MHSITYVEMCKCAEIISKGVRGNIGRRNRENIKHHDPVGNRVISSSIIICFMYLQPYPEWSLTRRGVHNGNSPHLQHKNIQNPIREDILHIPLTVMALFVDKHPHHDKALFNLTLSAVFRQTNWRAGRSTRCSSCTVLHFRLLSKQSAAAGP
jgi:hypothetical protein